MPWTRLDDRFHSNPKILGLSHRAFRLYVMALNWSVSELTDGRIPKYVVPLVLHDENSRARVLATFELTDRSLWKPDYDGWLIHDFEHYQETSAKVQERRSKWTAEKRGQRQVSAVDKPPDTAPESRPDPVRAGVPIPIPKEAKASMRQTIDEDEQIRRDGLWTALENLFGKAETKTERSLRGKVVKSLAEADASYSAVKERSAKWSKLFPGRNGGPPPTLTAPALEKWWGALGLLIATEELRVAPCEICDSRRIVGISVDDEVVKVDDPRAVANDRCLCVKGQS